MRIIPILKPGETLTLWDTELANEVIGACNRFLTLVVDPPLFLDKGDTRWLLTYDPDRTKKIPPSDPGAGAAAFYNTSQSFTASCPAGLTGSSVTVTIAANTIGSSVSVADANVNALALATLQAKAALVCTLGGSVGFDNEVDYITTDSAGRVYVAGAFDFCNGAFRRNIALFNSDLTLAPQSWWQYPDNTVAIGINATQIAVNSTGFYFSSAIPTADVTTFNGIAHLLINGTADTSFNTAGGFNSGSGGVMGSPGTAVCCAIDGSYVLCGAGASSATQYQTHAISGLVRLDASGNLIKSFPFTYPDAVTLLAGQPLLQKIMVTGAGDKHLLQDDNGLGFSVYYYNGTAISNVEVIRLDSSDNLDTSFVEGAYVGGGVSDFTTNGSSFYYFTGIFTSYAGSTRTGLVKTNYSGGIDSTFNPSISGGYPTAVSIDGSGKVMISGTFTTINSVSHANIARLDPTTGAPDSTFTSPSVSPAGSIYCHCVLPSGAIAIGGYFTTVNGQTRNCIAFLDSAGTLL